MIKFKKILLKEQTPNKPDIQFSIDDIEEWIKKEPAVKQFLKEKEYVVTTGDYVPHYQKMAQIAKEIPGFLEDMRKRIKDVSSADKLKCYRGLAWTHDNTKNYQQFLNLKTKDGITLKSYNGRTVFSWSMYPNRSVRFAVKSMSQRSAKLGVVIEALVPVAQVLYADRAFSQDTFDDMAEQYGFGGMKHFASFEDEMVVSHSKPIEGILVYHSDDEEGTQEFLGTLSKTRWDEW